MGQGNPLIKLKAKKGEQQNNQNDSSGKGGYNLKEHSVNIRIKYKPADSEDQQQ